ncbi:MAG TPA: alpha/beta fold hydrolase, partial [Anaerolineales bacterium]
DLHRAIFVGHSMGAAITLSLTLDYPEHVLGLGLIGAAARLPVATAILESSASPTTFQNAIELVTKWSFASQADPRLVELATIRMGETRPSVLNGDFVACDAFDVTARVSEIIQPALVIVGAEDRMTPPREAQFLASSLPKALLESIPNAGHMVMLEQPVAVAQALLQFFGKISY